MFLIDDLVLSPARGLAAMCKKVQNAASQGLRGQEQSVLQELSELHQLMGDGGLSDEEFNKRETALRDQLETVQKAPKGGDRFRFGS